MESMNREKVFISHANPEDNELALWLALQLGNEGYPVWCDLTKLLGGEDFWKDAEVAIREQTIKFLYVLSKTSNTKRGPRQELQIAHNVLRDHPELGDFIIPLLIDDLPPREINIQLAPLTAISFYPRWRPGLGKLLTKLHEGRVQRKDNYSYSSVASWWRGSFDASEGISCDEEEYLSNWFQINMMPETIYFHHLNRDGVGSLDVPSELPYPAFQYNQYLVAFTKATDFNDALTDSVFISESHEFETEDFLKGKAANKFIALKQRRDFIYRLLRIAWEKMVREHNLPMYELANGRRCFFFTRGMVKDDEIHFVADDGKEHYRDIVGFRNAYDENDKIIATRYWHFGIQALPLVYPTYAFILKPHVLFSDDGITIWESKDKLHRARRSQCRNWWNPEWRDRMLATMNWIAGDTGRVRLKLGSEMNVDVSSRPLVMTNPVRAAEPERPYQVLADGYDEEQIEDEMSDLEESEDDEAH
jgi:hypothetical protein